MGNFNKHIQNTVLNGYTLLSAFKLSGYLTLVDAKGVPVVFDIDGDKYIFTFNKHHLKLNISKNKKDFSFHDKLYIACIVNDGFKWKNMILFSFRKLIHKYKAIEPKNFYVQVYQGSPKFYIIDGIIVKQLRFTPQLSKTS